MDRLAPTRRPEGDNNGVQKWRDLLFVHWPVPVELVRPLVPARLSLDTFEDTLYVGLVPFAMQDVAPSWLPRAMAFTFLECNLRTYVHLEGDAPGVYFFSLEAASWLAVRAARAGWSLPYFFAKMETTRDGDVVTYDSRRVAAPHPTLHARYRPGAPLGPSEPGTLQHFLLERYLLYSEHRGNLQVGRVYHTPYPAHDVEVLDFSEELMAAAGLPPSPCLPPVQHWSPGVDVEVFALRNI